MKNEEMPYRLCRAGVPLDARLPLLITQFVVA